MSLPYNGKLKGRARKLRRAGNLSEALFWEKIKNNQFMGYDFDRQKIIGNYIADFYCASLRIIIEIDGGSHRGKEEYDAIRDAFLEGLGLTVIHIDAKEVKRGIGRVLRRLAHHPALRAPLHGRGTTGITAR